MKYSIKIAALALAPVAFGGALALTAGTSSPASAKSCTFDGGGTIASGDAARTSEGTTFVCNEDGALVRVKTVSKVTRQKHPQIPKWFHWEHASKAAAREVCGNGPAIIAWGGNGDTSVIICKNGKAETS